MSGLESVGNRQVVAYSSTPVGEKNKKGAEKVSEAADGLPGNIQELATAVQNYLLEKYGDKPLVV